MGVFNLHWDHPRLRGEKLAIGYFLSSWLGSPPLTRGKVRDATVRRDRAGITPAYAGKSSPMKSAKRYRRDHPRLRGEKPVLLGLPATQGGSPPLTRGKDHHQYSELKISGITPAYAGKSHRCMKFSACDKDHPRLRGEKASDITEISQSLGSPPLTRGKVGLLGMSRSADKDHPRLRGEKLLFCSVLEDCVGSPPLTRGKVAPQMLESLRNRITPAYAGKRLKKSKNTYHFNHPISAFHSVFQTQQMSSDNPQGHGAMRKHPFRSGMRVSSIYNPKHGQVFFLPVEAYRHRGF